MLQNTFPQKIQYVLPFQDPHQQRHPPPPGGRAPPRAQDEVVEEEEGRRAVQGGITDISIKQHVGNHTLIG